MLQTTTQSDSAKGLRQWNQRLHRHLPVHPVARLPMRRALRVRDKGCRFPGCTIITSCMREALHARRVKTVRCDSEISEPKSLTIQVSCRVLLIMICRIGSARCLEHLTSFLSPKYVFRLLAQLVFGGLYVCKCILEFRQFFGAHFESFTDKKGSPF